MSDNVINFDSARLKRDLSRPSTPVAPAPVRITVRALALAPGWVELVVGVELAVITAADAHRLVTLTKEAALRAEYLSAAPPEPPDDPGPRAA